MVSEMLKQFMPSNFDEVLRVATVVGALGTFGFAVYQWRIGIDQSEKGRLATQTTLDKNRIDATALQRHEATKPFLEWQLKLCTEATQVTARIAIDGPGQEPTKDIQRFWQLYWGELGLVENGIIARAMIGYGEKLSEMKTPAAAEHSPLRNLALDVAHACRDTLIKTWDIGNWYDPLPEQANSRLQ